MGAERTVIMKEGDKKEKNIQEITDREFDFYTNNVIDDLLEVAFCLYEDENEKAVGGGNFTMREVMDEFARRNPKKLFIEIRAIHIKDPTLTVYEATIVRENATYGQVPLPTAETVNIFLKGIRIGSEAHGAGPMVMVEVTKQRFE